MRGRVRSFICAAIAGYWSADLFLAAVQKAAMQGMKSYLERFVLPRVEQAEGRSR